MDQLELDIDSLAFGGRGVARSEGLVVFVAGALPGDRVRAEVTKKKRRFAEARTVELLRPAEDRLADRCVHEGEPCPGAPWQGMAYASQLEHKHAQPRAGEVARGHEPVVPGTHQDGVVTRWVLRHWTQILPRARLAQGEPAFGVHRHDYDPGVCRVLVA